MKALLVAGAVSLLAVGALAPLARAEGPRASSENNWAGMSYAVPASPSGAAYAPAAPAAAPHYVWQEGYDRGKWHGHWTLVQ